MKQYAGFAPKRAGGAREQLPAGGYAARILGAEEVQYSWGEVLLLHFDIIEGPHTGFFAADYKAQDREYKRWRGTYRLTLPKDDGSERDGWTKRTFENAIWALMQSNPGWQFGWQAEDFKGCAVGVLVRNYEWSIQDRTGWSTEPCALVPVEDIRMGNYTVPKDKPLPKSRAAAQAPSQAASDWEEAEDDSDLPFN